MKAVQMDDFGGPEVLHLREVPDPVAGPGQVVADIHAASINPVDWKLREGQRRDTVKFAMPHILGVDFSGVVRETAPDVSDFAPGDEVWGVLPQTQEGTYAEAVAADAALLAPRPAGLTHAEAAGLALVGATALVSLEGTAKLQPGETVLIHAGAGGVGGFAVQYAHHIGAAVYATASARNRDYVLSLGADEVIDYNSQDFVKAVPPCDVVFDTVGGDVQVRSFEVLKPGGRLAWIARGPDGFEPPRADVEFLRPNVTRERGHLDRLSELVAAGAVRPLEMTRMGLADIAKAHALSAEGHVRGKIVIDVR